MDCKTIAVVLACALLACGTVSGTLTTVGPSTITSDPSDITALPPITTTTTAPPTTVHPTTSAPSTTTSTAAPTTVAPTTPSPAPVTTAAPPSDGRGNWTVAEGNVTCIVAQMAISAKVAYPQDSKNGSIVIEVPASAVAEGSCNSTAQFMKLSWGQNNIQIAFGKNDTTKMYFVNHIKFSVFADNTTFPNINSSLVNTTLTFESSSAEFNTAVNQSYRCIREECLPLSKSSSTHVDAVLVLNKVQLQAFRDKSDVIFGTAQDCELETPDIIPIAVGCALAILVFVVLGAYLFGRYRSQAGYLSILLD